MLALLLALALQPAAPSVAQPDDDAPQVAPAAHAQNVEAYAAADIQKSVPTAIVALNGRQLRDPNFRLLANRLGDALQQQGFNVVERGTAFRNVVTLEYRVNRDVHGDLPGQSTSDPRVVEQLGPAAFPAYRRLTVTAYAMQAKGRAQVLWRTVMAEDGFAYGVDKTIPPLVEAGREYFGRNLTELAVADCNDFAPPIGSHIPTTSCGEMRTRVGGDTVRRPRVTVGPGSTPAPSVAAPPGR